MDPDEPAWDVRRTADLDGRTLADARALCRAAFTDGFAPEDWDHALGGWHVTATLDGRLVCHAAVVARTLWWDDRPLRAGYVEAVATAPDHRGRGLGSRAVRLAGEVVAQHFDHGALSTGAHGFYERLGWRRWHGTTWVRRDGGDRYRTPEDDDGLMLLLPGPATDGRPTDGPLTGELTCQERSGDDW